MTLLRLSVQEAEQADDHLRFLLAACTHAQRFVGYWLDELMAMDGLVALCYSSVNDYARERLGLSLRECQELMSIERDIVRYPETERMWTQGRINRCHVREILARVPPEDDFTWARLACELTVRQLQERLGQAGHKASRKASEPGEGRLIEISATPEFRQAFHFASTLVDRNYGREMGPVGCLEVCALEWHSTVSPEDVDRMHKMGKPPSRAWLAQALKELEEQRNEREKACELASGSWGHLVRELPAIVVPEGAIPEDPTPFDIDAGLCDTIVWAQGVEGSFMRRLARAIDADVPAALGFDSTEHYARESLGISATRLWSTLRLARALERAPRIEEAYHTGELSKSKAAEIVRVATPPTEEAWVEYAKSTTVRRLRDVVKVALRLRHEEPRRYADMLPPSPRSLEDTRAIGLVEEMLRRVNARGNVRAAAHSAGDIDPAAAAESHAVSEDKPVEEPMAQASARQEQPDIQATDRRFENAAELRTCACTVGPSLEARECPTGCLLKTDAKGMDGLLTCASPGGTPSPTPCCAGALLTCASPGGRPAPPPCCAGELPTCACRAEATHCEGGDPAAGADDDIPRVPDVDDVPISQRTTRMRFRIPPELDDFFDETFALCRAWAGRHMTIGGCINLIVCNFVLQHAEEAAREAMEHHVCERDGWRCTTPGCTRMAILHDHHLEFRSHGGSDELPNRTTLCRFHHLKCLHEGRMRAVGSAPGNIAWALGLQDDGTPAQLFADEVLIYRR